MNHYITCKIYNKVHINHALHYKKTTVKLLGWAYCHGSDIWRINQIIQLKPWPLLYTAVQWSLVFISWLRGLTTLSSPGKRRQLSGTLPRAWWGRHHSWGIWHYCRPRPLDGPRKLHWWPPHHRWERNLPPGQRHCFFDYLCRVNDTLSPTHNTCSTQYHTQYYITR